MNLVLKLILKLLSRPVVCANFQGLEKNTFFQLAESIKATVGAWYPDTKFKFSTYYNLVPRYVRVRGICA